MLYLFWSFNSTHMSSNTFLQWPSLNYPLILLDNLCVDGHFGYCLFWLNLYEKGSYWQSSIQPRLEWYFTCLCFQNWSISCQNCPKRILGLTKLYCFKIIILDSRDYSQGSKNSILDSRTSSLEHITKTYLVSFEMIFKAFPYFHF